MIKLIMCLHRKEGLSREQFQDYWQNNHGQFFMKNAAIMRCKKYVQSHTLDSPLNDGMQQSRGMVDAFDGVAECWFESEADLMEAMGTDAFAELGQALLDDESTFIDHERSSAFLVREVPF